MPTARGCEAALRMFCEYITDSRYEWPEVCGTRFGRQPSRIFHEWYSVTHVAAEQWAQRARRDWTSYIAERAAGGRAQLGLKPSAQEQLE